MYSVVWTWTILCRLGFVCSYEKLIFGYGITAEQSKNILQNNINYLITTTI